MTDIFDSITATLRERLVSPLAGSFIISWLIFNYKVVVILLSDMKPYVKFPYIEQHIWTDAYTTVLYGLVYPTIAALAYLLIYPWPARWVLQGSLWHQRKTKQTKIDGEGLIPVTKDDVELLKSKWSEKLSKQSQEIQRLEAQLDDIQKKEEESRASEQLMTSRASDQGQELEKLHVELAEIQAAVVDRELHISGMEKTISELNSDVEALHRELNSQKADSHPEKEFYKMLPAYDIAHAVLRPGPESGQEKISESKYRNFLQRFAREAEIPYQISKKAIGGFVQLLDEISVNDEDLLTEQLLNDVLEMDSISEELRAMIYAVIVTNKE